MPFGKIKGTIGKNNTIVLRKKKLRKVDPRVAKALRILKPEMKHIGFQYITPIPVNEANVNLNQIQMFVIPRVAGNDAQSRIGNKIRAMKIAYRALFRNVDPGTQNLPNNVRITLLIDKRSNKTRFALADLRTTAAGAGFLSPQSLRNEENVKRFRILMDRSFTLGGRSGNDADGQPYYDNSKANRIISGSISLGKTGTVITYDNADATGNFDFIESGTIWMLVRVNGAQATGPNLDLHARLYYTDV